LYTWYRVIVNLWLHCYKLRLAIPSKFYWYCTYN